MDSARYDMSSMWCLRRAQIESHHDAYEVVVSLVGYDIRLFNSNDIRSVAPDYADMHCEDEYDGSLQYAIVNLHDSTIPLNPHCYLT